MMSAGMWVVIGAVVWFVLALMIGPKERRRLDTEVDPY